MVTMLLGAQKGGGNAHRVVEAQGGHGPDGVADVLGREGGQGAHGVASHAMQERIPWMVVDGGICPQHVGL